MKHDTGGFTLIEVLVAISLMSLVMAGLTSMGITTIQADTHSRRQSAAVSLAQAKLEDLRVLLRSHADWTAGVHSGTAVEEDGIEYTREWEVEADYNNYKHLSRVTVTVSWDDGTSGSVSVSSLYW
jgi:prepilin-type N-terminal cleavage/methylation domain-containing protein